MDKKEIGIIFTREELLKLASYFKIMADVAEQATPNWNGLNPPLVVDCRIHTGDNSWSTDPRHFQIERSTVVFRNESNHREIKLEFTSDLVDPKSLFIKPLRTGTISVEKGCEDNITSCYQRERGESDWGSSLTRTGNGANMGIDNP